MFVEERRRVTKLLSILNTKKLAVAVVLSVTYCSTSCCFYLFKEFSFVCPTLLNSVLFRFLY